MNRVPAGRLAGAVALSAALLLTTVGAAGATLPYAVPRAWFDTPPSGIGVPAGVPVAVVGHATAGAGVALVQLKLGDAVLDDMAYSAPLARLVSVEFGWMPTEPGTHALEIRALGGDGAWGASAWSLLTVGDGASPSPSPSEGLAPTPSTSPGASPSVAAPSATPTAEPTASPRPTVTQSAAPTPTTKPAPSPTKAATPSPTKAPTPSPTKAPTPTPTPRPTEAPTPAPCTPPPPGLLSPPDGATLFDFNQPTFEWGYGRTTPECLPSGFRFQLSTQSDFSPFTYNVNVGPDMYAWTPPDPLPCDTYYWRVRPKRSDGTVAPASDVWSVEIALGCR